MPIAFVSKNLAGAQLRWSVPEKEAYGIFFAFQKMEHLLRDVHFTLRTDHKNLVYINFGTSQKIMRWKLMVQEYDFIIEHIAGEKNVIADAFSRLVKMPQDNEIDLLLSRVRVKIPDAQYNILTRFHNTTVGHHGVERTYNKLQAESHKWTNMREHVNTFVHQCPCCQKMSHVKKVIQHHPFVIASYEPMKKIAVDTIGPLPIDASGNQYIVTITDCFSRFVMLSPTRDATAESAARALLQWVGLFGPPSELLSDMGTQYINKTIDALLALLHTQKIDILAGIHEQNSIVERRIKEVNRHLRAIIYDTRLESKRLGVTVYL